MSEQSADRPIGPVTIAAAELGLLALAAGTAVSLSRLLEGSSWLGDISVVVVAAWGVALGLRRLGVPTLLATLLHLLSGAVVLSWLLAPGTLAVGVVPTAATWHELSAEVRAAFAEVSELIAPVAPSPGFVLALAAVMWVVAGFADTAAMRYRAPAQAAAPFVAVFVAAGVLAREHARVTAAIAFGVGVGIYVLTQRLRSRAMMRWVTGLRSRGLAAEARSAVGLLVGAAALTAVAWPLLPIDDEPVVDLRELGRGTGPRTAVSPFVGIRSMLTERSDEVMFTVLAEEPAYWRLTALDTFDDERDIWVSRATYQDTGGQLPPNGTNAPGPELVQEFRLKGLATLWLPVAYAPRSVVSDEQLSFDPGSSSLILRDGEEPTSLRYSVVSEVPTDLDGEGPGNVVPDENQVGSRPLPDRAMEEIERFRAIENPAEQMRALQDWFREFTYDETVDYRGHADPITAFLEARRGFCQQFSSAFALFARELGLPSRVAVGFTPGETVSGGDPSAPTEFVVRGRNAHAWPEVYLLGSGWVPFEPTPQRGNPQAQGYTGVPPEQAEPPSREDSVNDAERDDAAAQTEITSPPDTSPEPTTDDLAAIPEQAPAAADGGGSTGAVPLVLILAAVLGVAAIAGGWLRRRSRIGADDLDPTSGAVARAWNESVAALSAAGLSVAVTDTPRDIAVRAQGLLDSDGAAAVVALAELEGRRLWSDGPIGGATAEQAEDLARRVTVSLERGASETLGARS